VAQAVKVAAGGRCVRCGHRAESALSRLPCDAGCDERFHPDGLWLDTPLSAQRLRLRKQRILTVHHLDSDKENLAWWNLPALCQVCHLAIQGKSRGEVVRIYADRSWLEREIWLLPYGLGWLAHQEDWALSQQAAQEGATRVILERLVDRAELNA
jgi:hypothetical protein